LKLIDYFSYCKYPRKKYVAIDSFIATLVLLFDWEAKIAKLVDLIILENSHLNKLNLMHHID
jgi:hypothetical protein